MTTKEFIEKVNALSEDERHGLVAFMKDNGAPAIADTYQCHTLAYLPGFTKRWVFATYSSYSFPGRVLKLMGELADSKYHEREKKYVILNGKPHNGRFDCFLIDIRGRLNEDNDISRKQLEGYMYYTKSELDEFKGNLPQRMQKAVDVLIVPLEEALKMGENNE